MMKNTKVPWVWKCMKTRQTCQFSEKDSKVEKNSRLKSVHSFWHRTLTTGCSMSRLLWIRRSSRCRRHGLGSVADALESAMRSTIRRLNEEEWNGRNKNKAKSLSSNGGVPMASRMAHILLAVFTLMHVLPMRLATVSTRGIRSVLHSPAVFGHFLDPPGNHPRGAIFPTVDKINQSSVDFHCKPFEWLIDWLTISQFWLDWFIGFVSHDLFLRGRG